MRVVQAPEVYDKKDFEIACFMGGGMGNTQWHEEFFTTLNSYVLNKLVVYNPYNPNITDVRKQIEWEFNYLNNYINDHFIFSMYFDKYTDQPISMYELGRVSVLHNSETIKLNTKLGHSSIFTRYGFPAIVSIHPEAPKKEDIKIQCELAGILALERTPEEHADAVIREYDIIKRQMGG